MYEYDDAGRLVRSTSTSEPEWTEQDQAEVLALLEYRDSLCPCCGLPKADVFSHEADGPVFEATRRVCRARLALVETQRAIAAVDGKTPPATAEARQWSVSMRKR